MGNSVYWSIICQTPLENMAEFGTNTFRTNYGILQIYRWSSYYWKSTHKKKTCYRQALISTEAITQRDLPTGLLLGTPSGRCGGACEATYWQILQVFKLCRDVHKGRLPGAPQRASCRAAAPSPPLLAPPCNGISWKRWLTPLSLMTTPPISHPPTPGTESVNRFLNPTKCLVWVYLSPQSRSSV